MSVSHTVAAVKGIGSSCHRRDGISCTGYQVESVVFYTPEVAKLSERYQVGKPSQCGERSGEARVGLRGHAGTEEGACAVPVNGGRACWGEFVHAIQEGDGVGPHNQGGSGTDTAGQGKPPSRPTPPPAHTNPAPGKARPDDTLVRRGTSRESAQRLGKQAAAEKAGTAQDGVAYEHGVSVTTPESNARLATDPVDAVSVTRRALEAAGFEVRHTPIRAGPNHHTVQLPRP
jgi:hypothetical protein